MNDRRIIEKDIDMTHHRADGDAAAIIANEFFSLLGIAVSSPNCEYHLNFRREGNMKVILYYEPELESK